MDVDPLLARARGLWELLAAQPVSFPSRGGLSVVTSPGSRLCPPSWAGVVELGGSAIVTAPDRRSARMLRRALSTVPPGTRTDADALRRVLPVAEVLGPAALAYLADGDFRPSPGERVDALDPRHPGLGELTRSVGEEGSNESGIEDVTSPVFVVRDGSVVVAAAGYRTWPGATAHLSVLTDQRLRGRGLARRVASAAVAHARADGLLPQWRARPETSRRVARSLGFRDLGSQLSLRPEFGDPARER
ncbi:GNAT family N-acetyltransferase [Streptomyces meridianus]|uniref:GNAT family N-acetyltransferase n=1 Tax=Streptomyces meridianus TaxID=2938945 RepID=A0ABT0X9F6_9ACTN|nr:GNAT family N-acetyltransferase [Streptomyces meridianus]MCM2579157.1 GNAT family N-acetyltransferase [Streptomyces meridianus]